MRDTSMYPVMPVDSLALGVWSDMATLQGFIGDKIYRPMPQQLDAGILYKLDRAYDQHYNQRVRARDKAPYVALEEKEAARYALETLRFNYFIDPDKVLSKPNPAKALQQERLKGTKVTTRAVRLDFEIRCAAALFDTGTWTNAAPATLWDQVGAKPIHDLMDAAYTADNLGIPFNTIVFGGNPWRYYVRAAQALGLLPTDSTRAITTNNILQTVMGGPLEGVNNIYVGRSSYTSSNPTAASVTRSKIWGDYVWIGYVDPNPTGDSSESATVGPTLEGMPDVSMREWRDEAQAVGSSNIEASSKRDVVNLDTTKGYLIDLSGIA